MRVPGSVTIWIGLLRAGDAEAAENLWRRYFSRLVDLARGRLQDTPHLRSDAEDIALSAFESFAQAAAAGRFPDLADRSGLWRLLVTITAYKLLNFKDLHARDKRGGRDRVLRPGDDPTLRLERIVGREPSPALAAQVAEEYRRLLEILADDLLRRVAVLRMEGYTTAEIAAEIRKTPRTVERKLRLIRDIWSQSVSE